MFLAGLDGKNFVHRSAQWNLISYTTYAPGIETLPALRQHMIA
jgi:hypothetical protein